MSEKKDTGPDMGDVLARRKANEEEAGGYEEPEAPMVVRRLQAAGGPVQAFDVQGAFFPGELNLNRLAAACPDEVVRRLVCPDGVTGEPWKKNFGDLCRSFDILWDGKETWFAELRLDAAIRVEWASMILDASKELVAAAVELGDVE